jgi:hypothetical protein
VDDSALMVGLGSSVEVAVNILLALGLSTVVVFVCALRLQAQLRLLRWAIRRPFHSCAACHARNSSVALWRWQSRSPCWLCAECAFGVKDFDEVPRSRRQPRMAVPLAVADRHRHGRHEADEDVAHHAPPLFGTHAVPKQRLTIDNRGQQTRVAVPPAVADRHRHGRHEADEDVAHHAPPLFGTHTVPKQPTTNGVETAVDSKMTANGQHGLETNGHQLVKAPPVDPSSKDDRLNEPRWIGRWPTGPATFPVDAHDGHQPGRATCGMGLPPGGPRPAVTQRIRPARPREAPPRPASEKMS